MSSSPPRRALRKAQQPLGRPAPERTGRQAVLLILSVSLPVPRRRHDGKRRRRQPREDVLLRRRGHPSTAGRVQAAVSVARGLPPRLRRQRCGCCCRRGLAVVSEAVPLLRRRRPLNCVGRHGRQRRSAACHPRHGPDLQSVEGHVDLACFDLVVGQAEP